MPRKILYIINPISGTRGKQNLQQFIQSETSKAGIEYEVEYSNAEADYAYLEAAIREKNFTDIVIAGGDGTVNQVVAALKHLPVQFGIIPCGSGNGLALAAGIPKDPAKALDIVFNGVPQDTDGFWVNHHFSCMLTGFGFDAKVAHEFSKRSSRGLSAYTKEVMRNFFKSKFYKFRIELKDRAFETEAFFISIANSNQFGNQFTIAPKASLSDGKLDIVIVRRQSKTKLLFQILKQVLGKNKLQLRQDLDPTLPVIYFQTSWLRLQNISKAPLHIDGDPGEWMDMVEVKTEHPSFRLLYPA